MTVDAPRAGPHPADRQWGDERVPEVSVLLPTDSFETVEKILACLRAQPRADRLEIVLVAPPSSGLEDGDARVHGFAGVRVIEAADIAALPRARARALRAASAPLVLFAETHAYPNAEYLDRLVEAHAGPVARGGAVDRQREPGQPHELGLAPDGLRPVGRARRARRDLGRAGPQQPLQARPRCSGWTTSTS